MKFFALIMIGLLNVGCSDSPKCETPVCTGDSTNNSTNNSKNNSTNNSNNSTNNSTNNATTGECSLDVDCELGTVCAEDKTCVRSACDFCTPTQVCLVTDTNPDGSCSAPECATHAECTDKGGVCTAGLCGAPTVDISEYDQACDNDTDCALVNPSPCGCSCPETGINADDETAFNAAADALNCAEPSPVCAPCEARLPACWESKCRARTPQVVKAEDFDNSCVTAADCVFIWVGEICEPCQCPTQVVNLADYEANRPSSAECTPAPVQCLCAQPPAVKCNAGVCDYDR